MANNHSNSFFSLELGMQENISGVEGEQATWPLRLYTNEMNMVKVLLVSWTDKLQGAIKKQIGYSGPGDSSPKSQGFCSA